MKRLGQLGRVRFVCAAGMAALALLAGCTLGGAAAGGYAGNRLTHGSTLGTVGGAVAGGVVGYELSK